MARKFIAGDVVQLMSGGPLMTIESVSFAGNRSAYWCAWFSQGKDNRRLFAEAALKRAELKGPAITIGDPHAAI